MAFVSLLILASVVGVIVLALVYGGFWTRLIVAVLCGAFVVLSLPLFPPKHQTSRRAKCMAYLHQVGIGMKMYSMDNGGKYPDGFESLTNYAGNPRLYVCPSSGHLPGEMTNVSDWTDYALVTGLKDSDPGALPHAVDRPENHRGDGANVLHVDGSVQWLTAQEWSAMTNNIFKDVVITNAESFAELTNRVHVVWPKHQIVKQ